MKVSKEYISAKNRKYYEKKKIKKEQEAQIQLASAAVAENLRQIALAEQQLLLKVKELDFRKELLAVKVAELAHEKHKLPAKVSDARVRSRLVKS